MSSGAILVRCDGNAAVGLGHLSRCLALSEACDELGFRATFVGDYGPRAEAMIREAGFTAEPTDGDPTRLRARARAIGAAAIVTDGYHFDADYLEALGATFVIDDFGRLPRLPSAARVLNFTVGADAVAYPTAPERVLRGPAFLLVRRAVRALRREHRTPGARVARLLVSMGGVDRHGAADRVARTVESILPSCRMLLVAGMPSPAIDVVAERWARTGAGDVVVGAPSLAPAFATSDACVTAGGLTKYEAVYLGVPVAVLSQNDGEERDTRLFHDKGIALDLGRGDRLHDAALERALGAWFEDVPARAAAREAGLSLFPEDPTRAAAEALVRDATSA